MKKLYTQTGFFDTYEFLEKIFNNTYDGIVILNFDGHWLKVNDSICEMLGYTRNELFNMDIQKIIYREDKNVHELQQEKLVNGKIDQYRVEQRYFHKDGTIIWVLVSVSLIKNHFGQPHHLIWQFNNITKRKANKGKLKAMLSVAREQNDRLISFADIITHNLRSHSGNLSTITEFLEEDMKGFPEKDNLEMLKKAVKNLEDTVSHLTQVAKIKEIAPSEMRALNLYDYVEKAIYNIATIAKNSNTDIINNIDDSLYVKGIPAYLDSIILNFLTNAIKYRSDKRLPKIRLTSDIQNEYVVLNIRDNGLGIDLIKYGKNLFHMYKTFHYNKDAVGIGLFITKNHIESLGGKVFVRSKVDIGTEFSIYFKQAILSKNAS